MTKPRILPADGPADYDGDPLQRIARALERIADCHERQDKAFNEMVEDGRTLAVLSKEGR